MSETTGPRCPPGVWLAAGPLAALLMIVAIDLQPDEPRITAMAAVALWMAIWWVTEAVPLGATALLPVVLFPLLGIMGGKDVAPVYFNSTILLFLGGFLVAIAMERWALHRRIALRVILTVGGTPRRLIWGFLLASWFLSMWISNTACTMMMLPIAMAVIDRLDERLQPDLRRRLSIGLLLAIAYAASIGGLATLIGTPPNLSFVRILHIVFPAAPEVTFAQWLVFALPVSLCLLVAAGLLLSRGLTRGGVEESARFRDEYAALGPLGREEKVVLADFVLLALLWMTRSELAIGGLVLPGWSSLAESLALADDGTVAVALALLLFCIPARGGGRVLDWSDTAKLPWGIVLLFGGGFAVATGFTQTGLSDWIGGRLEVLGGLPPVLMVGAVCLLLTFLTELTSNTATTEMVLPILAALAVAVRCDPLLLMIPATLSASCAFMLPVATPPNAIVFGTGRLTVADMARAGLWLNLLGVVVITALTLLWGSAVFGFAAGLPDWAG